MSVVVAEILEEPLESNDSPKVLNKLTFGNRCGHDRKKPNFVSVINPHDKIKFPNWNKKTDRDDLGSRRKPAVIYEIDKPLRLSFDYPRSLENLNFHDGSGRKVRSERREADIMVVQVIYHYTDFASLKFGYQPRSRTEAFENGFTYYDVKFICAKTGLSESRVKRSIRDLKAAGFITKKRRFIRKEGGKYKGKTSSTMLTKAFFKAIGLWDKVKNLTDRQYKKAKKKAAKMGVKIGQLINSAVFDLVEFVEPSKKVSNSYKDYPESDSRHYTRRLPKHKQGMFQAKLSEYDVSSEGMTQEKAYKEAFDFCNRR